MKIFHFPSLLHINLISRANGNIKDAFKLIKNALMSAQHNTKKENTEKWRKNAKYKSLYITPISTYILRFSITLSSLLTRGVCRGRGVRDGQEKSFNKTIYSIGSMTRRDFGAPFFPPPTFCLQFIWANAAIQRLHERKRKKGREGCLTVKWVSGRSAREREVKKYWNLFSFVACSWCYNSDKSPRREARLSCSFYRSHFHFSELPRSPIELCI